MIFRMILGAVAIVVGVLIMGFDISASITVTDFKKKNSYILFKLFINVLWIGLIGFGCYCMMSPIVIIKKDAHNMIFQHLRNFVNNMFSS